MQDRLIKGSTGFISRFGAWLIGDARHFQILFLSVFLFYGINVLRWETDAATIIGTFFTCLITQALFTALTTQDYRSLKSAFISAMSLCLMLRTNSVWVMALASLLSISSKFILRTKFSDRESAASVHKHFFNPTNFGIITTLLITGNAWISPGQWGSSGLFLFVIGFLGLMVLLRARRLDTAFAFLLTYGGLLFIRSVVVLGWEMDFFLHQLSSGTLLLFSFFMITDPVSTPSHPAARILWASLAGMLAFYLASYEFVNGAPLWALFVLSPLTVFLDKLIVHSPFSWIARQPAVAPNTPSRFYFLSKIFSHP